MIKKKTKIYKYYRTLNGQMSPVQNQIVEMLKKRRMSAVEIAEKLNLKPDNVRAYISKASRYDVQICSDREKFWIESEDQIEDSQALILRQVCQTVQRRKSLRK